MIKEILEGSNYEDAQKNISDIFKNMKNLEKVTSRKEWNQLRQYIGDAGQNLAKAIDLSRELGTKYNTGN